MAERTGLEPATPGVTGRYSNQLNYRSNKQTDIIRAGLDELKASYNCANTPPLAAPTSSQRLTPSAMRMAV